MTTAAPAKVRGFAEVAEGYARDVVEGRVPASHLTRLACQRHLDDLARPVGPEWPWRFDAKRAERVCRFAELMPHIKGEWANRGETIALEPWQVFVLAAIFGWVHYREGYRRFRTAYVEVPRKNAKTTLAEVIGLYMLALDGEAGAEVYTAATTRDQARYAFDGMRAMASKTPELLTRWGLVVEKHQILVPHTGAVAKPITREQSANEGLSPHLGLCDELHAHKSADVYEVLDQAKGARRNALLLSITTAGSNLSSICYQVRQMIVGVLEGTFRSAELERVFGIIYTIDEDDDPDDPQVWRKANPNLGVSVYEDDLADQHAKAKASPARWNEFLTKRLNVWVRAGSPWFDSLAWRSRCLDEELAAAAPEIPERFDGRRCYVGIDLATRRDLAAVVAVFPEVITWESPHSDDFVRTLRWLAEGHNAARAEWATRLLQAQQKGEPVTLYYVFGRYYLPEEAVSISRNAAYSGWVRDGWVITTPGETTDFAWIKRDVLAWASRFDVAEVPYDPREARQLATELENEHGLTMVEFRQGYSTFNEPMKTADALIASGLMRHNGDPVLTWAVGNVVGKEGALGDVMPAKDTDEAKIDPAVAMLMALGRATVHVEERTTSVYESRGVRRVQ